MYQVRDGKIVAIMCDKCGCRLLQSGNVLTHYYGDNEHDARGCICEDYYVVWLVDPDLTTTG